MPIEHEEGGERLDRLVDPVTGHALAQDQLAHLDQVVGRGHDHEQGAPVHEHPPELGRIAAGGDRGHELERGVGVGEEAVRVGHDPVERRMQPRRDVDRGHRDVEAVSFAREPRGDGREVMSLPAADVEQRVARAQGEHPRDGLGDRGLDPSLDQSPTRLQRGHGVPRPRGSTVLGLQEIDVAAPGHVERVPARAAMSPRVPSEGPPAAPDRAQERDHAATVALRRFDGNTRSGRRRAVRIVSTASHRPSRARFRARTFTRGSPRSPQKRPSVFLSTTVRTASGESLRSRATRET